MKIDILTLFPEMFNGFLTESIIKRAIEQGHVSVRIHNFRDYSKDPHHKVDDTPYGGGAGMVLTCQPIYDAIQDLRDEDSLVIMLTPDGKPYQQEVAYGLSKKKHLILLCGHYEGFDERIRSFCDMEISIGDYVLTGGELAAAVIADAVVRIIPGVISDEQSALSDSFQDNLLAAPVYTRPAEYKGWQVPDVLLSGHEAKIKEWELQQSLERTQRLRPDLLK